jgi:hypothetical protein
MKNIVLKYYFITYMLLHACDAMTTGRSLRSPGLLLQLDQGYITFLYTFYEKY